VGAADAEGIGRAHHSGHIPGVCRVLKNWHDVKAAPPGNGAKASEALGRDNVVA